MRKLTHEEILARQQTQASENIPVHIVLDNLRSLHNVGSIFRTCDGAGIEKIWLCGITGHPPNAQIHKTALGSDDSVCWEYRQEISSLILELKNEGFQIILLEQMDESRSYQGFMFQKKTALIVGNEVEGISESIVSLADGAIEIKMEGVKNSLNVGVALGIVVFHMRQQISGKL